MTVYYLPHSLQRWSQKLRNASRATINLFRTMCLCACVHKGSPKECHDPCWSGLLNSLQANKHENNYVYSFLLMNCLWYYFPWILDHIQIELSVPAITFPLLSRFSVPLNSQSVFFVHKHVHMVYPTSIWIPPPFLLGFGWAHWPIPATLKFWISLSVLYSQFSLLASSRTFFQHQDSDPT